MNWNASIRFLFAGSALVLLRTGAPAARPEFLLCGFRWLTGLPCPLCGMTRALCLLAKGDWIAAMRLHAMSPMVFAMLIAILLDGAIGAISPWNARRWIPAAVGNRLWSGVVVLLSGYGALRIAWLLLWLREINP